MTESNQQAMELSDEQLMARVAARDSAAFGLLYDRHAAVVLGVVVKIVGDRAVGEEVLQESYWRLWTQAATFDPAKGPLRAWLFSIARRQALDVLRRQSVRPAAARDETEARRLELAVAPDDDVPGAAEQAIAAAQLRGALSELSAEQQRVLELAYFGGLTRQEIARVTETPLGTVHTRARLGLQALRAKLGASGNE
jgi:RNA polymerase sigma-70 factor (ECF subfamily)